MKKVIAFFRNRIVISIIGLIVLSLLIWFVGPQIKFGSGNVAPLAGDVTRLIVIMVIVGLWGLNNLRLSLQDKKHNDDLVSDLQENQSGGNNLVAEQSSEEMHVIGQRFSDAMATLRKLKFRGRRGRQALYELPWYIIIGPPGSGKTTALVNSSLDFPLADKFGKEALRGVGGTRNCDWWFTNEAVLIDTAGRYTTQDSHKVIDSASWDGFLNLLKKHRRRRPINGAIIAISLQELMLQTEEERMAHARTIRARIDELMNKLEIRFPIYLMFTKSDLIAGFNEYFEDLTKHDRDQVWGVTLPNLAQASDSPDIDQMADEYDALIKRLYQNVISRIHQERDLNRRAAIEGFPQQMENLKEMVLGFVKQAFVKNRYQYQPYLRGVYFTSGVQDGMPIDRLMSSVSASFGFDRQTVGGISGIGKSYFIGKLFREVIFPESELVGTNRRYESMLRWAQRAGYTGLAILTAGLLLTWAGSFTRNEMYMHQVQGYIADYHAEKNHYDSSTANLDTILPSLNALAKASKVYNRVAHPWLAGMGMYDPSVDDAAGKAYNHALRSVFLPAALRYLEGYLRNSQDRNGLYDNFRTYMMFEKTGHFDKSAVKKWFESHWARNYHAQPGKLQDLTEHLNALLDLKLEPVVLNSSLVAETRSTLMSVPLARRVFNRLKTNPAYSQKVDLLNNFGDSARTSFEMNNGVRQRLDIPVLYTKQVYKTLDLSPKSEMIQNLAHENWVLSDKSQSNGELSDENLKKVSDSIKTYYYNEYRNYWSNVYSALKVKPFNDLQQANETLREFVDPVYSPLVSILQTGYDNTTLTSPALTDLSESKSEGIKGKALKVVSKQVELTPVDKAFRELNQLSRKHGDRPRNIQNLVQKIRQMQAFVNNILISPDPGKKAYQIARARYQGGGGNAMTDLVTYADTLPQPVNRWMHTLADQTWKVILRSAHSYVSNEWNEQVYTACSSALKNRYPFARGSGDDVSMLDFTQFFKPGGTIDKFSKQYIKPFVDAHGRWTNKGVGNYSIGFSRASLNQVRNANLIRKVFFSQNPASPSFSFQMKPYEMMKTDERFVLEIGNKKISYSHGPKFWTTIKWMGNQDDNTIRLVFEDLSGRQTSETFDGPWSLFKLQDSARLHRTSSTDIYLATFSLPGVKDRLSSSSQEKQKHSISYEIKPRSVHNPFDDYLIRNFRCTSGI